jgi:hypothetical protein
MELITTIEKTGSYHHLITRGKAGPLTHEDMDGIGVWKVPFFPFYPFIKDLHFMGKPLRGIDPGPLFLFVPFKRRKTL